MSTHYDQKTLMKVIQEMEKKEISDKNESKDLVTAEWQRLASFMKQRK